MIRGDVEVKDERFTEVTSYHEDIFLIDEGDERTLNASLVSFGGCTENLVGLIGGQSRSKGDSIQARWKAVLQEGLYYKLKVETMDSTYVHELNLDVVDIINWD